MRDETTGHITREERAATLVAAAMLTAFGIFWMVASSRYVPLAQLKPIDLTFLPYWSGAVLAIVGAAMFVRFWRTPSGPTRPTEGPHLFEPRAQLRVLGALVAVALYILVLTQVHFLLSTFALIVAGLILSGEPLGPRPPLIAAIVTAVLFLIFLAWLAVPLPGSRYGG